MRIMKSRTLAQDDGASLVLALIFVIAVSIVVGSLLSYSGTGLRSDRVTEQALQSSTDVGGTLQTAINDVRNSDYFNSPVSATPCLGSGNQKTYPALSAAGLPVTVTCAPDATSGGAGGLVHVNDSNRPGQAVLTLGSGAEVGLDKTGNRPLKIKGAVYSNSTIRSSGSTACPTTWPPPSNSTNCNGVFVQGPDSNPANVTVTAENGCVGTVVSAGSKNCPSSHSIAGDDPAIPFPTAYAQPTAGATPQALPTCAGNPVTFDPGYYDDAVGLSQLMGGGGACGGKTFWFRPGVYYFDFHNSEMPSSGSPVIPNGPDVWTFNDASGVLVGGTKQGGWTGSTNNANMPGSCVSPLTSESTQGVQFVFGGDSQFHLSKGSLEICGTWYVDRPSLVLYGAKQTTGSITNAVLLPKQGSLASTSTPAFAPLNDNSLANAADSGAGPSVTGLQKNKTATLQVNGFTGLSSPVARRAVLEQATVQVKHGELGYNAGTTLTLTLTPNRAGAVPTDIPLTLGASVDQTVDVTSALRSELYAYGLSSASVPFTAKISINADSANGQSISAKVDYLKVTMSWRPIAVRAQSGCVIAVSGCPMLQTDIHTDELYLQGTAYTPRAALDVRLVGVTGQVFRAGLIARTAALNVSPSNGYEGPLIELPDNSFAPTPLRVYLTAWSCPLGGCSMPPSGAAGSGWQQDGRTLVKYTDGNFVPIPSQRAVEVQSWKLGS